MSKRRSVIPQGPTWADDLNSYVKEKCHNPPPPIRVERFVKGGGKTFKEDLRDYNPILGRYRSEEKDAAQRKEDDVKAIKSVNRARENAVKNAYHGYDIITVAPKYGLTDQTVASMGGNQEWRGKKPTVVESQVPYNIITCAGPDGTATAAEETKTTRSTNQRQVNIITHKYVKDDERRQGEDADATRQKLEENFCATRSINPLTGKYYDTGREVQEKKKEEVKRQQIMDAVANNTYRASNIERISEGHAYNILNQEVKDTEATQKHDSRAVRGLQERCKLRQQWEYQRDVDEALREADAARSLNRITNRLVLDTQKMGFNPVTNEEYGLTKAESCATTVPKNLQDSKRAPLLSMSQLKEKSVLEKLMDTTKPREKVVSHILHDDGPRTTHEKLFGHAPAHSATASFESRTAMVLPDLPMKKARNCPRSSGF